MLSFITILNTKFRSLKQTAQSARSQLFKKVSLQIQILQREAAEAVVRHRVEIVLSLVALSYLIDVGFTLFEFDIEVRKKYHPFYDGITYQDGSKWNGWVTQANFYYGLLAMCSRASIFLSIGLAIWLTVKTKIYWVCLVMEVFDMIDYKLTRNGPWFTLDRFLIFDSWEFEWNYIKIGIVLTYCYIEWKRLKYTGCLE